MENNYFTVNQSHNDGIKLKTTTPGSGLLPNSIVCQVSSNFHFQCCGVFSLYRSFAYKRYFLMKPGSKDKKVSLLITGEELSELKRHSWQMIEAFGLDNRIEKYQGKRQIGLYSWDMDCIIDVIEMALDDPAEYPDKKSSAFKALKNLHRRFKDEYRRTYK